VIVVRLPLEIEKRLKKLARTTGRTKTFHVGETNLQQLNDLEDDIALQRLQKNLPGAPLEEVEGSLGLRDRVPSPGRKEISKHVRDVAHNIIRFVTRNLAPGPR
jgi:RHH-type transcriptional regulator, rel operon repressor / antitoxin RelB